MQKDAISCAGAIYFGGGAHLTIEVGADYAARLVRKLIQLQRIPASGRLFEQNAIGLIGKNNSIKFFTIADEAAEIPFGLDRNAIRYVKTIHDCTAIELYSDLRPVRYFYCGGVGLICCCIGYNWLFGEFQSGDQANAG